MRLKKLSIIIIKVVLILFLVITLNRIFIPKYINENRDGRITQEYYPFSKYADVLFVGSSTVYSGIDPRILWKENGISSYIRANASQTMWISYYMTEEAVSIRKPELVCLDMTFIKYDDDFVEEPSTRKSLDGMRLDRSKINCIKASMGEDERMVEYIIPLMRFHSRWKELTFDDIRYAWYLKNVTYNGHLEDKTVEPAETDRLEYFGERRSISPMNMAYLRKTIELCQNNNVQIMLFKMPSLSGNWSDSLDEQINDVADEYGITYINFDTRNEDIGLDYGTDTPDKGSHLNSSGASKFSVYLGDLLKEDYDITDRRDESSYKQYWKRFDL